MVNDGWLRLIIQHSYGKWTRPWIKSQLSMTNWLVVSTNPSDLFLSVGMMTFPRYGKSLKNVPNHQPDKIIAINDKCWFSIAMLTRWQSSPRSDVSL